MLTIFKTQWAQTSQRLQLILKTEQEGEQLATINKNTDRAARHGFKKIRNCYTKMDYTYLERQFSQIDQLNLQAIEETFYFDNIIKTGDGSRRRRTWKGRTYHRQHLNSIWCVL